MTNPWPVGVAAALADLTTEGLSQNPSYTRRLINVGLAFFGMKKLSGIAKVQQEVVTRGFALTGEFLVPSYDPQSLIDLFRDTFGFELFHMFSTYQDAQNAMNTLFTEGNVYPGSIDEMIVTARVPGRGVTLNGVT